MAEILRRLIPVLILTDLIHSWRVMGYLDFVFWA